MVKADFKERVFGLIVRVPRGKVTTYGEVAKALGSRRAARAVGRALNANTNLVRIPCHRVVRSDGTVGGYRSGVHDKMKLLAAEGVKIEKGRVADFYKVKFIF